MPQSTPPLGGAKNATNELLGISFAMVLKPDQNQIFENQDQHLKAAPSAALTRARREAPTRPTARKALRARSSEPSEGRFTFPPTPLPAGHPPGQLVKNLIKHI